MADRNSQDSVIKLGNNEQKNIALTKLIMLPLTIFTMILSLPILFMFIWLLYIRNYDCEDLLNLHKLQAGITTGLFIVFVMSNVLVYMRLSSKVPAIIMVVGLVLVMVPLFAMLVIGLGLVGVFNVETRIVPGSSTWLKMNVYNNNNWNGIKSCIYNTRSCNDLASSRSYLFKSHDFTKQLTHTESGCCLPPSSCGMEFVNATYWKKQSKTSESPASSYDYDQDCDLWRNEETVLCYDCQGCKDGFIKPLKDKWRKLGVFLIVMSALLILAHLFLFVANMLVKC